MHRIDSLAYGYNIQSYDANIVAADKEGQGRYGWFLHQSMGEKCLATNCIWHSARGYKAVRMPMWMSNFWAAYIPIV